MRNTSFERKKSQQEDERENLKNAWDVEDVWKRGYGDGNQIAWLFLALVRAAGIPADPVIVSTRDVHFFNPNVMNPNDLNSNVVVVTLDGKDLFLDPGTALAPFGTLPWAETDVSGLRLTKDGGDWVTTPSLGSQGLAHGAKSTPQVDLVRDARRQIDGDLYRSRGVVAAPRRAQ